MLADPTNTCVKEMLILSPKNYRYTVVDKADPDNEVKVEIKSKVGLFSISQKLGHD